MRTRVPRAFVARLAALVGGLVPALAACADVSDSPTQVASLEFARSPVPAIEIGDSLRDTTGVAVPVRAIARSLSGEEIVEAPLRYAARESLVLIDSLSGHVVPDSSMVPGEVNVVARFAEALQIATRLRITRRPDTVARTDTASLRLTPGAIGQTAVDSNSVAIAVRVEGPDASGVRVGVADWLVRFAVVQPANPGNDTTAAVFLIDDNARPSAFDTTASPTGVASRRVRVRESLFPAVGVREDTVVVEAAVMRRGLPVPGAPVRIHVPVRRP